MAGLNVSEAVVRSVRHALEGVCMPHQLQSTQSKGVCQVSLFLKLNGIQYKVLY